MIAFFFTMPISRMMPMIAMIDRSLPVSSSASSAPTPADGSVDRIVIGWMKLSYSTPSTMYIVTMAARISHSSLVERGAERERRALEVDRARSPGAPSSALRRLDRLHGIAQRRAAREVERDGRRRKLADVVDRERRRPLRRRARRSTAAPAAPAGPARWTVT